MHPASRQFLAQVHRDRPEEYQTAAWLYGTAPEQFRLRLSEALTSGDANRVAASFEVERRHGALWRKHGSGLWEALLTTGQYKRALDILQDEHYVADRPDYWFALARALAGLGRLEQAAEAASRAADSSRSSKPGLLQAQLDYLAWAEPRPHKLKSWEEVGPVIDGYLEIGLPHRALPWLIKAARTTPMDEATAAEIIRRAHAVQATTDSAAAMDVLLALRPIAEMAGAEGRIDHAARAILGEAPFELPADPGPLADGPGRIEISCGLALAAAGRTAEAIQLLGRLAVMPRIGGPVRYPLAKLVGDEVIEQTRPSFRPRADRKIVDVFPFFDEFEMLSLKLEEMADWVDHFVILEASETFTGKPKPLHFWNNRDAFARYADKIVHVRVDFPPHIDTPWAREFYQRDIALPELVRLCGEDDLVLLSDLDEIANGSAVRAFERQFTTLEMPTYEFFLNVRLIEERPLRAGLWRAKYLQNVGLSHARLELVGAHPSEVLPNSGWHFSSIREVEDLTTKYRSYSHINFGKLTTEDFRVEIERIRQGQAERHVRCEIDGSYPEAVHRNRERLERFVL